ncbi:MAG: valine--tRNA ligase, partial [Gemmatimonadales bacterium]
AKVDQLQIGDAPAGTAGTVVLGDRTAIIVLLGDLVDRDRECTRLASEANALNALVATQERKLGNEQFVARAPAPIVAREREKLADWRAQADALREKRRALECTD